jgi:hypothetical protein
MLRYLSNVGPAAGPAGLAMVAMRFSVRNWHCKVPMQSVELTLRADMEESTMPQTKQVSKRKGRKEALPVLGAVGMSLSLAGGASAATGVPAVDTPSRAITPSHEITLNEEEVADVSLATFYVFDKENTGSAKLGERFARGCGCGRGCGGRGCGGRGCGRGCGCGVGGCGCGGCGCCSAWRPWLCVY